MPAIAELLRQGCRDSRRQRAARLLTLEQYVSEWREKAQRGRVAPRTFTSFAGLLERHVLPALGEKRLTAITSCDVQEVAADMLAAGLSGRTVRYARAVLRNALQQAVKWCLVARNPADDSMLPTHRPGEKTVLTSAERARFIAACRASFYGTFCRLLVDIGLRPGEACALTWADVDLARDTITVERAVTKGKCAVPIVSEPKAARSRRTVPVLDGLREELLRHLDSQHERGMADGPLFANQDGQMLRPWTSGKRDLERTLQRAGITKHVTLNGLRHTFATLHVAAGTPVKVVSDVLGHANIQQTANTSMHGDQAVTADWMQRFERQLNELQTPMTDHRPN